MVAAEDQNSPISVMSEGQEKFYNMLESTVDMNAAPQAPI